MGMAENRLIDAPACHVCASPLCTNRGDKCPGPVTASPRATALQYVQPGWWVIPLCWPDARGKCGCGRGHQSENVGKAPLTKHGGRDSSDQVILIRNWWTKWPNANIGIVLKRSGLFVIAPDSPEWLDRFAARGLTPTLVVKSGGGEGHFHYYYRRPPDAPIFRINRSSEYDIQSDGYMVAPPSRHASGRIYLWI